jgi:DNA-binding NarL/FixJ family response regulator
MQIAINEGIPFRIKMADGEKYEVADRLQIAMGKAHVVVLGKHDMPHILPLLTMTGISYLKPKPSK